MLEFRQYLEYAERCVLLASQKQPLVVDVNWLLVPATIMAWTSIEAFVNSMADDFGALPEGMFELHERALLLEKRVRFKDEGVHAGTFVLEGTEYRRLEDKILFLLAGVAKLPSDGMKGNKLWNDFQAFKQARDRLMHPKRGEEPIYLTVATVEAYIEIAKELIQFIALKVWGTRIEF